MISIGRCERGRVILTSLRKLLCVCLVGSCLAASASGADTEVTLSADIGPQPLAEALAAFGRLTGLQLIYVSEIAEALPSRGARGTYGLRSAHAAAAGHGAEIRVSERPHHQNLPRLDRRAHRRRFVAIHGRAACFIRRVIP